MEPLGVLKTQLELNSVLSEDSSEETFRCGFCLAG